MISFCTYSTVVDGRFSSTLTGQFVKNGRCWSVVSATEIISKPSWLPKQNVLGSADWWNDSEREESNIQRCFLSTVDRMKECSLTSLLCFIVITRWQVSIWRKQYPITVTSLRWRWRHKTGSSTQLDQRKPSSLKSGCSSPGVCRCRRPPPAWNGEDISIWVVARRHESSN